jgi:hypothetical protein
MLQICYRQFVIFHLGTFSHLMLPDLTVPKTLLKHSVQSNFVQISSCYISIMSKYYYLPLVPSFPTLYQLFTKTTNWQSIKTTTTRIVSFQIWDYKYIPKVYFHTEPSNRSIYCPRFSLIYSHISLLLLLSLSLLLSSSSLYRFILPV